jgi:hypothetical protein
MGASRATIPPRKSRPVAKHLAAVRIRALFDHSANPATASVIPMALATSTGIIAFSSGATTFATPLTKRRTVTAAIAISCRRKEGNLFGAISVSEELKIKIYRKHISTCIKDHLTLASQAIALTVSFQAPERAIEKGLTVSG